MPIQNPFELPVFLDGEIVQQRPQGQRSLFLFNETHTDYQMIRRNLINACRLLDLAEVGLVAVEGPYTLSDQIDDEIVQFGYFDDGKTDAEVIESLIAEALELDQEQPGLPHFLFADALRILRPTAPICYVDNDDLANQAEKLNTFYSTQRTDQLYDQLIAAKAAEHNIIAEQLDAGTKTAIRSAARHSAMLEFREHDVQKSRDVAFIDNMFHAWQAGIAILNAGSSHLNRIADNSGDYLPQNIRFIQVG